MFFIETYLALFKGTSKDDLAAIEEHIADLEELQNAPFTEEGRNQIIKRFGPPAARE
jgi:hypothetical protein